MYSPRRRLDVKYPKTVKKALHIQGCSSRAWNYLVIDASCHQKNTAQSRLSMASQTRAKMEIKTRTLALSVKIAIMTKYEKDQGTQGNDMEYGNNSYGICIPDPVNAFSRIPSSRMFAKCTWPVWRKAFNSRLFACFPLQSRVFKRSRFAFTLPSILAISSTSKNHDSHFTGTSFRTVQRFSSTLHKDTWITKHCTIHVPWAVSAPFCCKYGRTATVSSCSTRWRLLVNVWRTTIALLLLVSDNDCVSPYPEHTPTNHVTCWTTLKLF